MTFTRGTDSVDVGPGGAVRIPAGLPHTMTNLGSAHALVLEIYTPGALLERVREVGSLASEQPVASDELHALYRKHQSEIVVG